MVVQQIQTQLTQLLSEFEEQVVLRPKTIFVVGCSTSEVIGQKIGTAGALETAEAIFEPLQAFAKKHQLYLAFQGCEHINRALTLERQTAERLGLELQNSWAMNQCPLLLFALQAGRCQLMPIQNWKAQ